MTPALINDPGTAQAAQDVAKRLLPDGVIETAGPFTMGGEDFAFMMEKVPGLFMFIGSANPAMGWITATITPSLTLMRPHCPARRH